MTAFIPSLLNAALVKITLLVMIGCSALTALTKTAMAFLIDQVITAYPTIETTRSSHTLFFHHPTNLNHCTYAFMRLIGISLHPYVFACMQLFDFLLVGWGKVLSQAAQILSARDYDEIHKI
jgi:hypothetical protein